MDDKQKKIRLTGKQVEEQVKREGLRIIRPKIPDPLEREIRFPELDDDETLAYIMCQLVGWSYRRMARKVRTSHQTIRDRVAKAREKRRK